MEIPALFFIIFKEENPMLPAHKSIETLSGNYGEVHAEIWGDVN